MTSGETFDGIIRMPLKCSTQRREMSSESASALPSLSRMVRMPKRRPGVQMKPHTHTHTDTFTTFTNVVELDQLKTPPRRGLLADSTATAELSDTVQPHKPDNSLDRCKCFCFMCRWRLTPSENLRAQIVHA